MPRPGSRWHDFVVLSDHQSAVLAVRRLIRICRADARTATNAVMIHGPTGTGKSTLVRAIVRELGDDVLVLPATDLGRTVETIDAIVAKFLVIEDMHRVSAEQAETFVTVLDARASRRRPTVITSGVAPADLTELPHRLTSRLAGSLVVTFPPLSEANRAAMAEILAAKDGKPISKATAKKLARSTGTSLRPLVGAIQQAKPGRRPRLPSPKAEQLITEVATVVGQALGVSLETMRGPTQNHSLSTARQLVAVFAFDHRHVSYMQVENYFTRRGMSASRDHLAMKLLRDPKLKLVYDRLDQELRRTAPSKS